MLYDASQFAIEPGMSERRLVVCSPRWRGGSITSVHFPLSSASRAAVEFLKIQVIKVTLVRFTQLKWNLFSFFFLPLRASLVCLEVSNKISDTPYSLPISETLLLITSHWICTNHEKLPCELSVYLLPLHFQTFIPVVANWPFSIFIQILQVVFPLLGSHNSVRFWSQLQHSNSHSLLQRIVYRLPPIRHIVCGTSTRFRNFPSPIFYFRL